MSSSFAENHAPTADLPAIVSISPITLPSPGRGVDLHLRVSLPISGDMLPVIIFSHGNGQSFHAYGPLADYWAAHGFAVIQPTHLDSRMLGLAPDDPRRPQLWRFREKDLATILDGLDHIESQAPMICGRLDHARIAVAGHSWGGQTASTFLGATHPDPDNGSVVNRKDNRIKAGVLLAVDDVGARRAPVACLDQHVFDTVLDGFDAGADVAVQLGDDGAGQRARALQVQLPGALARRRHGLRDLLAIECNDAAVALEVDGARFQA
ncbi:alpha/beta fold hydrolase, partial [Pseudomonas aeruginosa]|nr:alpha/beta fold hydrolase [Pseudomonas aeruginosa]